MTNEVMPALASMPECRPINGGRDRDNQNWETEEAAMAGVEAKLFSRPVLELALILDQEPRLGRAWRVIELNYQNVDLRLDEAAKLAGTSRARLNILLRRAVGLTFHQLLVRYRLFQAVNAMASDDCGLLVAALAVGFGSERTFQRNFRRIFGAAPRSWRIS
ncbi:MAG TPA: AraC family transcriptional regulator [Blastocatellia bacterium]|nr:AraC family transcriptional regulator [Blastocatellia bacterium]